MHSVNLSDAQSHLGELITGLHPGEQLTIVQNGAPMAVLTRTSSPNRPCKAGSAKDLPHWMAPDFDAPLEDFREYSE